MKIAGTNVLLGIALVFTLIISGCKHTPVIPESPAEGFQHDVLPILISNCTASGCHGASGDRELKLTTYPEVMREVVSGDASQSRLYLAITGKSNNDLMPPSSSSYGQLTDTQITIIYLWIMQGAKNN